MLDRLIQFKPEAERAGLSIGAVTQGKPGEAKLFCAQRAPGIHCLADPERNAYRAYGLGRINWIKGLLSARGRASRAAARAHGHRPELPPQNQDALQTSGVFVVGSDSRLQFVHVYEFSGDHPDFQQVVNTLKPHL